MTTHCIYCQKPIDARTLRAGGEVCFECATGPNKPTLPTWAKPLTFFDVYRQELHRAVAAHPDEYAFGQPTVIHGNLGVTTLPAVSVDTVADKMIEAMKRRSFSKEGRACKATCKRLGIKHTYTAIYAHLEAEAAATGP